MAQPVLVGGRRRWKTAVLLQNRNAFLDALITDIYGRAGDKARHLGCAAAAERAAQSRLRS
jgi:hypothetical protein